MLKGQWETHFSVTGTSRNMGESMLVKIIIVFRDNLLCRERENILVKSTYSRARLPIQWSFRICRGLVPGLPNPDTKIRGCSGPLHKTARYLHVTYTPPLLYFLSSLDYFKYLMQFKSYVNTCYYYVNIM